MPRVTTMTSLTQNCFWRRQTLHCGQTNTSTQSTTPPWTWSGFPLNAGTSTTFHCFRKNFVMILWMKPIILESGLVAPPKTNDYKVDMSPSPQKTSTSTRWISKALGESASWCAIRGICRFVLGLFICLSQLFAPWLPYLMHPTHEFVLDTCSATGSSSTVFLTCPTPYRSDMVSQDFSFEEVCGSLCRKSMDGVPPERQDNSGFHCGIQARRSTVSATTP